ncbi:MAG: ECF transporter S component [Clostridia bacterium]|nr:ECF transporter S component [Clostridia bacterium]
MKYAEDGRYLRTVVFTSLFAALTCVATLIVQIPMPMGGYMHLGDAVVLLSGWLLGPVYGVLAAAIGSMLADLFTGYFLYVPATFVIKGLVALVGYLVSRLLLPVVKRCRPIAYAVSGILAEAVMIGGYLLFEATLAGYGLAGALLGVPNNAMQALLGVVAGTALVTVMEKMHLTDRIHIRK